MSTGKRIRRLLGRPLNIIQKAMCGEIDCLEKRVANIEGILSAENSHATRAHLTAREIENFRNSYQGDHCE